MERFTDAEGNAIAYQYDFEGNLRKETHLDFTPARETEYQYDKINHLTKVIDPKARIATTVYDLPSPDPAVGEHLVEVTDPLGAVVRTGYDKLYREKSVTEVLDGSTT